MATTNITVKHRPNRIGLLVRPGELKDVERAAEICRSSAPCASSSRRAKANSTPQKQNYRYLSGCR